MNYTTEQQVKNAIKWVEALRSGEYKQAPFGNRAKLGNEEDGYCCLGVGCVVLELKHSPLDEHSSRLKDAVGLRYVEGNLLYSSYYRAASLGMINDMTHAGFKRIGTLLKTHPEWVFKMEVAKKLKEHYQKETTKVGAE